MAWNQSTPPSGNGGPSGGNRRPPGTPDPEDWIRRIHEQFSRWLGGNDGKGPDEIGLLKMAAGVGVVLWVMLGFYRVEQAEEAVVFRFGKFHSTQTAGLHWAPRLVDNISKVNIQRIEQMPLNATMITEDANIVDINLSVQYRVLDARKYLMKVSNPEASLQHATESALRHVVGGSKMTQILNEGRATLARDIQPRLQAYLDSYECGLQVTGVNVLEALPPKEVKASFDDVIRAKEDKERLKNQAETYANGIVPEARGQAARLVSEAEAYKQEVVDRAEGDASRFVQLQAAYRQSPQVMRQRLYLETMESVLGKSSKVVVEAQGNQMLYLPLDKMIPPAVQTSVQVLPEPAAPATATKGRASE
jgi:membrane protease subunit HflK